MDLKGAGQYVQLGMSLRDWFAGQVASGLYTNGDTDLVDTIAAARCYAMADALLAERAKGQTS